MKLTDVEDILIQTWLDGHTPSGVIKIEENNYKLIFRDQKEIDVTISKILNNDIKYPYIFNEDILNDVKLQECEIIRLPSRDLLTEILLVLYTSDLSNKDIIERYQYQSDFVYTEDLLKLYIKTSNLIFSSNQ